MDIFTFRATQVVNSEGVFETFKEGDNDLGGLFMRLKNVTIAELHTQWDVVFLDTYIKQEMVPRSLRWDIAPQKGDTDLEGWFKHFNDSGLNLLKFLGDRKTIKLKRLDDEIILIKEKLTPFMSSEEYTVKSQSLLKILEKEEREQKIKKKKKFNRDFGDYHNNIVFEWQKKLLAEATASLNPAMEVAPSYSGPTSNIISGSNMPQGRGGTSRTNSNNTPKGHQRTKKQSVPYAPNLGRGRGNQRGQLGPPPLYYGQPWGQGALGRPNVVDPRGRGTFNGPPPGYPLNFVGGQPTPQDLRSTNPYTLGLHPNVTQRYTDNEVVHYAGTFEPDYNVLTHNSFLPLGNMENIESQNFFSDSSTSQTVPPATYELGYPSHPNLTQSNWGFPKAGQGTKRLAELKEGAEGANTTSPKRPKT